MPFYDFFRNFFGRGPSAHEPPQPRFEDDQRYRDSFRNPIWQIDEDEEDASDFSNRQPRNRYQFRIFSDPFEMTRFFETQMDDMMKNFFGFGNSFGSFDNDFSNALPMPDAKPQGPRDEVLKPSFDMPDTIFKFEDFTNIFSTPDNNKRGPVNEVLKPSYDMPDPNQKKQDSDIDGKYNSDDVAKIWKTPSQSVESFTSPFSFRSFGKSVSMQTVQRADGSVEHRRTVRDSDGNEETTITRQIGDKMHTVITKKAKDGTEIKSEDMLNMDENELKGFDDKWKKNQIAPKDDNSDNFPWHKFFGPNPKL